MLKRYTPGQCYIIAEIGGNFTNFEQARDLIDAAADCGVDCVKLQTYRADTVSSKHAMFDMENTGETSQYELFKLYEINEELHKKIFDYIESKDLDLFSTPSHETDLALLESLNVEAHKIGSDDASNLPFLRSVAQTGKPVLISTGMCTLDEVKEAVDVMLAEGNDQLAILHAITSYPTHAENVNLSVLKTLRDTFPGMMVGYSDHTLGTTACICAAAMGADILEKHFTCDKNADGPDHRLSADPVEMKHIVNTVREFEVMRGNGIKRPADSEKITRRNNRKSVILMADLKAGQRIERDMLMIKRPGTGIAPKDIDIVVGRTVIRDMQQDDVLQWEDLG